MAHKKGELYLIPVGLGGSLNNSIPLGVLELLFALDEYIVENERTARRFLISAGYKKSIDNITFHILNKHTDENEIPSFMGSLEKGKNVGLLSEAGCPCIADPGQVVVNLAQVKGYKVKPLTGPNSMIMALMASGFNGQCFSFKGYLPIDKNNRENSIKEMEKEAIKTGCTQIFMETPFRNNKMLEDILKTCKQSTMLCAAIDITMDSELIITKNISGWKKTKIDINKRQVVFLINRNK